MSGSQAHTVIDNGSLSEKIINGKPGPLKEIIKITSELEQMNMSDDKKAELKIIIEKMGNYCCKCGDMWAGDLPPEGPGPR